MGFSFVSAASAGISAGTGDNMSAEFGTNFVGDLLVVVVMQLYLQPTAPAQPTIIDSAGNNYLVAFGPVVASPEGNPVNENIQLTVFYTPQCFGFSENTITINNDENVLALSTVLATEYKGSLAATIPDPDIASWAEQSGNDDALTPPVPTGELLVSFALGTTNNIPTDTLEPVAGSGMTPRYTNQGYILQDGIGNGSSLNFSLRNSNDNSNGFGGGFVAFKGFSPLPLGGSSGGTSSMQILGGPKYSFECLPEGRRIACAVIDCTILAQVNGTFNFPELNDISGVEQLQGFVTVSFDLANFLNGPGAGLSECWSVIAYCKPMYGITPGGAAQDDFQVTPSSAVPALLTNVSNGQTIVLGGGAVASGKVAAVESVVFPFPYYGTSMPVRFIAPFLNLGLPLGKYTLLFCNFNVGSAASIVGFFEPSN